MLDELYCEPPRQEINKEEITPFQARFPQKKSYNQLNMQQFLEQQY
jgi:hypothetical protein